MKHYSLREMTQIALFAALIFLRSSIILEFL